MFASDILIDIKQKPYSDMSMFSIKDIDMIDQIFAFIFSLSIQMKHHTVRIEINIHFDNA